MTNEKQTEALTDVLQRRIRTFSRVEKVFYGSIILTAITMAIGIIFLQSRNLQVQQDITSLNKAISEQQVQLDNAKQEVNELSNRDRITKIAEKAGLSNQQNNIQKVD
ncbi:cell division protein FtsL [Streptococcus caballi]|uniref:cell division protein FtsL n=1 Tax=Streptococcus caballi TaxID=439220 RepID=UPI000368E853|nr:cell division protein FtsL [Streptococcus caballi]